MYRAYRDLALGPGRQAVVQQALAIALDFQAQGYNLTLRQLYYQFVAQDLLPNTLQDYKRLGDILNDARLAGEFPWDAMVDRTREHAGGDFDEMTPQEYLAEIGGHYVTTRWLGQDARVEVWVEKEAMAEIVERAAGKYRAGYFSCRGYTSASSLWAAAQRIEGILDQDGVDHVVLLHLGDHDPSGIDMTRDIEDRMAMFLEGDGYDPDRLEVRRIALNMDQVQQYSPPPNPAKLTDSRSGTYIRRFGRSSWELDALNPATLDALISSHIERSITDRDAWARQGQVEAQGRRQLSDIASRWDDVVA